MAELPIVTFEQIETILSKVATNYSELALVFYDVFYNTTPMDVTFQMFDEAGVLQTYTIPNRAKDFNYILNGEGNPENKVAASMGSIYQDLTNGNLYIKQIDGGKTGWNEFVVQEDLDSYLLKGTGSPEGLIEGQKGLLYVDTAGSSLYIKTTSTGTQGWYLISANTDDLANRSLDNLTVEGEAKFANPSLTNLSEEGQQVLDSKENISNKVTTLSATSTNEQYPSAKVVYDYVNARLNNLANINLSNLSSTGELKFLGMGQVGDCILSAPRGLVTNSGNQVTIPSGTILLCANGLTSSYALRNQRVELGSAINTFISWSSADSGIIFYDSNNNILRYCKASNFYSSVTEPIAQTSTDIWFNPQDNTYHYVHLGEWELAAMVRVAEFETDSEGNIDTLSSRYPVEVATKDDLQNLTNGVENSLSYIRNILSQV